MVDVKPDTLKKAIRQKRIILPPRNQEVESALYSPDTKSERTIEDNESGMGKACTNTVERVLAYKCGASAPIRFGYHVDVSHGGILLSIPSLLANGLLRHSERFSPDGGYYSVQSVFLCLAFLFLLRIRTLAQTEGIPCGELGRAMGLDRIPEVKTLRMRIRRFCERTDVKQWLLTLSKEWMAQCPEVSGVLYVDGHVKIYYGEKTKMPRRYVSRMRLCMSGSTDYWVNDKSGQPFFVVNEVAPGSMLERIKQHILPELSASVPNQPAAEALEQNPLLPRYMLVFDREGYSPEFFYDLWQDRIAVCTYKKNVNEQWPEEEFTTYTEVADDGQAQHVKLAERGVLLKSTDRKKQLWCREIRKLCESGHQTAIITTHYLMSIMMIGVYMFARWSQENFFKYMLKNFDIDGLVSYAKDLIDETTMLVNPAYRELEGRLKKYCALLARKKVKFASIILSEGMPDDKQMQKYLAKKSQLLEEMEQLNNQIVLVKEQMQKTERKISFGNLPEEQKFTNAVNERKHFLDTIKLIAYRAETAMCNRVKKKMGHPDEARKLIRQVYESSADISPDYTNKKLIVSLHHLSHWKDDKVIEDLCEELNQTETKFPGTDLTIFYKMVSS